MERMIERVAKAICRAQTQDERMWQAFLPEATAAIEAMREPTAAIVGAGHDAADYTVPDYPEAADPQDTWHAMIDAALSETDA